MRINHNIASLNTYRQLTTNTAGGSKPLEKLSSGLRINRSGDDTAGLAISEKMRGQIRGLDQASRNAQDGISMIQTAEGALNETHSILQRMRELAVQSANDTNVDVDRSEIQKEIDELAKEITRISNSTEFNTQKLINGGKTDANMGSVKFHVGANTAQDITLSINAVDAKTLGISRDISKDATGTLASTGNTKLASVSFADTVGIGIVDGAEIEFAYTAGTPATKSSITGGDVALGTVLTADQATMTINVGGNNYTLQLAGTVDADADALAARIGNAKLNGTGPLLSSVVNVTASAVDGAITLEAVNGGATAITVSYSGTSAAAAATYTGIANNSTDTGTDGIADRLSITNGTYTQNVSVVGTANTFTVSNGSFAGMTIGTGAATLANIHADDQITVAATTVAATTAQFSGGALTADAVTEAGIDVSSQATASNAISTIQNAIETVSAERSKLGAYQNRLEHTIANLGTSSENLTAAESRVRDVDMAKEMMEFTKNNILQQAATAMLAQANQQPQGVLQLLQ
ncbi:MAG: flagellin [Ruminiclostridium sp.]|nr:flagellin [Ruminiclostridium sp.]